jgi:hypothetical protein
MYQMNTHSRQRTAGRSTLTSAELALCAALVFFSFALLLVPLLLSL